MRFLRRNSRARSMRSRSRRRRREKPPAGNLANLPQEYERPMMMSQKLIVLAGLPGFGKSTLAEGLSRHFSLPLFSVDPIEAAMWRGGLPRDQTGIAAYVVAQTLAEADRPGSPNQRRSERGPRPLRLWILALGFARHRRDLERGD